MSCPHLTPGEYAADRAAYSGCPDCAQEHEEREAEMAEMREELDRHLRHKPPTRPTSDDLHYPRYSACARHYGALSRMRDFERELDIADDCRNCEVEWGEQ